MGSNEVVSEVHSDTLAMDVWNPFVDEDNHLLDDFTRAFQSTLNWIDGTIESIAAKSEVPLEEAPLHYSDSPPFHSSAEPHYDSPPHSDRPVGFSHYNHSQIGDLHSPTRNICYPSLSPLLQPDLLPRDTPERRIEVPSIQLDSDELISLRRFSAQSQRSQSNAELSHLGFGGSPLLTPQNVPIESNPFSGTKRSSAHEGSDSYFQYDVDDAHPQGVVIPRDLRFARDEDPVCHREETPVLVSAHEDYQSSLISKGYDEWDSSHPHDFFPHSDVETPYRQLHQVEDEQEENPKVCKHERSHMYDMNLAHQGQIPSLSSLDARESIPQSNRLSKKAFPSLSLSLATASHGSRSTLPPEGLASSRGAQNSLLFFFKCPSFQISSFEEHPTHFVTVSRIRK
jgi:hypothetical protein